MSEKEMDRMDREVMALVNERQTEQEEQCCDECGTGNNPSVTADAATAPFTQGSHEDGEQSHTVYDESTAPGGGEKEAEKIDWDAPLQEKNGKYCISKEAFEKLKAELKRSTILKNAMGIAVCIVIMGALFLIFSRPELLNYIVGAGVISCSITIGVCLARLVEVNR